jgi:hypothetical protein
MKAIVRLKYFPGHVGIPGHQGGSLPRGADSVPTEKYHVELPGNLKAIDYSHPTVNIANNPNIDNSKEPPYVIKTGTLKRITRAHGTDLEVMKEIAKDEQDFYDNPNSTGSDNHIEVRLFKGSDFYGLQYTSFDLNPDGTVYDSISWTEDFSRCPVCGYPTLSPDEEQAGSSCNTCGVDYEFEE